MGKHGKKHKVKDEPKTRTHRRLPESSPPGGQARLLAGTGARDETYDLVSVLYHALQGAQTCNTYLEDAEASEDGDLAEFFEDTRAEHVARAALAKQLLLSRLLEEQEQAEGGEKEVFRMDEDAEDLEEGEDEIIEDD